MSGPTRPALQVAFLTGQSRPPAAALSPAQTAFLAALPVPAAARVAFNFPYPAIGQARPFTPTPLLVASLRNARQYFASRRSVFSEHYSPAVEALLDCADHTLFLAGSCGLELFNNLGLPVEVLRRVTIFAFGPVARRRPDCACLLVQGRRDWISRGYFHRADVSVEGGHMDYLTDPAVVALAAATVPRLAVQAETSLATR